MGFHRPCCVYNTVKQHNKNIQRSGERFQEVCQPSGVWVLPVSNKNSNSRPQSRTWQCQGGQLSSFTKEKSFVIRVPHLRKQIEEIRHHTRLGYVHKSHRSFDTMITASTMLNRCWCIACVTLTWCLSAVVIDVDQVT